MTLSGLVATPWLVARKNDLLNKDMCIIGFRSNKSTGNPLIVGTNPDKLSGDELTRTGTSHVARPFTSDTESVQVRG